MAEDSGKEFPTNMEQRAAWVNITGCAGASFLSPSSKVSQELLSNLQMKWVNIERVEASASVCT